jgi:hypothetical protein
MSLVVYVDADTGGSGRDVFFFCAGRDVDGIDRIIVYAVDIQVARIFIVAELRVYFYPRRTLEIIVLYFPKHK